MMLNFYNIFSIRYLLPFFFIQEILFVDKTLNICLKVIQLLQYNCCYILHLLMNDVFADMEFSNLLLQHINF